MLILLDSKHAKVMSNIFQENVQIHAAYGSSRDISVYSTTLKLKPQRIFILGKKKSKKADHVQVRALTSE